MEKSTKFCPSCDQEMALEHFLEGTYLMSCCEGCGMGLGVRLGTSEVVRAFQAGTIGEDRTESPALGRVKTVKRAHPLGLVVEKAPSGDPRSMTPVAGMAIPPSPFQTSGPMPGLMADSVPPPPPAMPVRPEQPQVAPEIANTGSMEWLSQTIQGPRLVIGLLDQNKAALQSVETPVASVTAPEPAPAVHFKPMGRVMVVEDGALLRRVTADLLKERGYAETVVECVDGSAFLEAFVQTVAAGDKPDLVVLDMQMPGLNGLEVAYATRAIEAAWRVSKRTPLLFYSASPCDEACKQTLKALGNARYLRKASGAEVGQLGEKVASVVGRLVGALSR